MTDLNIPEYDSAAKNEQFLMREAANLRASAAAAEARADAARAECQRLDIQRTANRMVKEYIETTCARFGLPEMKANRIVVTLKKPKAYYTAQVEAVSLMLKDSYLLDRPVKATIAEVLPEASRRAQCVPALKESVWYNEFSPTTQKAVNRLLTGYKLTKDCNTLSKVRALLKQTRKGVALSAETGTTLGKARLQFNGDGTLIWFGEEHRIVVKGKSRYVRQGSEYINIDKTLKALGIPADDVAAWEANAAILHAKRRSNEAAHDEAEFYTGSKYD